MSILYPYQKEIVKRTNRFEINIKARQIGYSFAFAYKMLKRCIFEDRNQLIVSASLRQSKVVMGFVEKFIRAFKMMPSMNDLKLLVDTQTEKRFNNGKSIICLPPNPNTIRSFAGDVLLDEFSMYAEDEKVYEAVLPSIMRNFDIIINSTPLGQNNLFYEIQNAVIQNEGLKESEKKKYKNYKRYEIDIYEAIKQGLNIDIQEIKDNYDDESFRQEFLCEFIDESTTFFPFGLIKSCFYEFNVNEIKGNNCIGVDIGRTNDNTGIAVTTNYNDKFFLTDKTTLKKEEFDIQKLTIKEKHQYYVPLNTLIDKGAIGYQLAEELEKELSNCLGVFTNQLNFMNDVVTHTKKLMEQGKFKLEYDKDVMNAFHRIKKVVGRNNSVKYEIKRDKKGHGDIAVAIMLSLYGFKDGTLPSMVIDGKMDYENRNKYKSKIFN